MTKGDYFPNSFCSFEFEAAWFTIGLNEPYSMY